MAYRVTILCFIQLRDGTVLHAQRVIHCHSPRRIIILHVHFMKMSSVVYYYILYMLHATAYR